MVLYFILEELMNKRIEELCNFIQDDIENNSLTNEQKNEIIKELNTIITKDYIVLAQINPHSGNVKQNAIKAFKWIKWAQNLNVSAIVFPEMYLIGYPIGDFIDRFPIIVEENMEWLNALATITDNVKVIM